MLSRKKVGWSRNSRGQGVAVAALLARAGVQRTARFLKWYAGDYTVLLPLASAHGAPLRLVAPGRVCWYSVKWVDRLEVLAEGVATTGEGLARARLQR
jgi:DMSO/TMAO reductase YedYZ molybdopterin-dependent catalytic subunit